MSNDKNWQRELTAYIDGELSDAERRDVEAALASDPSLAALERKLRQTVTLMKQLAAPAPSTSLKASVLAKLDDAPTVTAGPAVWFRRAIPVVALAAAAALVFIVRGREEVPPALVEDDQVLLAQNIDVVEDLDLVGLAPEDLDVVEQLNQLDEKKEATP